MTAPPSVPHAQLELPAPLADRLADPASRIVVLTGAGISRAAGIPTYRGDGGLYPSGQLIPLDASQARSRNVHLLWQQLAPLRAAAAAAEPTSAHRALAAAAAAGRRVTVITQNVGGLHVRAGSGTIELHGNLARARCLNPRCPATGTAPDGAPPEESGDVARCVPCGARLRPDVVLFGERLNVADVAAARTAAHAADVVLAVGTSLQVHPAAGFVVSALGSGAVGAWLELDPAAMFAELGPLERSALSGLHHLAGDAQATLPALLALADT